jgi:hypothetical protein
LIDPSLRPCKEQAGQVSAKHAEAISVDYQLRLLRRKKTRLAMTLHPLFVICHSSGKILAII